MGMALLCLFFAMPKIDWEWIAGLSPIWFIVLMIAALAPVVLLLLWLEKKIRNRKIWWGIRAVSWLGCFALALSGYYIR
jgi:hypothetical protein